MKGSIFIEPINGSKNINTTIYVYIIKLYTQQYIFMTRNRNKKDVSFGPTDNFNGELFLITLGLHISIPVSEFVRS